MDRATLQGNVQGEQTKVGEADESATYGVRRPPTTNVEEDKLPSTMASSFSLPAVDSEWDAESDFRDSAFSGSTPGRHRRDSSGAVTPSLIDEPDFEDEEEQEMVSYETERLMRNAPILFAGDDQHIRRTPGASMYRSSYEDNRRRTPGAYHGQTPSSAAGTIAHESGTRNASVITFDLGLSSPVASDRAKPLELTSTWDSSLPKGGTEIDQITRPLQQGGPSREQRGALFSPLNLSKVGSRQGAYSPHTLRLTEDLGNLLLEDEGDSDSSADSEIFELGGDRAYGGGSVLDTKKHGSESWTAPYVMQMDAPTRAARTSARGRRGKSELSRRAKGFERPGYGSKPFDDSSSPRIGGFLQYPQQPKAVGKGQLAFYGHGIGQTSPFNLFPQGRDGFNSAYTGEALPESNVGPSPSLINFGGAFAPPSRNNAQNFSFQASVSDAASQQANSTRFFHIQPAEQPAFTDDPGHFIASSFHDTFHHPGLPHESQYPQTGPPHFSSQHVPKFDPQFQQSGLLHFAPGPQLPKFDHQYVTQPFLFGSNHPPVNPSPIFSIQPHSVVYPMHGVPHHPPSQQDFIPVMQQQPPHVPQYEQVQAQRWVSSPTEVQYDGATPPIDHEAVWRNAGGWPMGEYGYSLPRASDSPALSISRTTPTWTQEADHGEMNLVAPHQVPQEASSPVPSGKGNRKNLRKGRKKSPKPQSRSEKSSASSQAIPEKKSPIVKKAKKKTQKTNIQDSIQAPAEETAPATTEDVGDFRRTDPEEASDSKGAFKEFSKKLRAEERTSFHAAQSYAFRALSDGELPESIHWKVYLELADLAKRANRFAEARNLYRKVCQLQPHAIQGWLEFSKLEEECGNMKTCAAILRAGIEQCEYNDGLYARAIKHEEKMGDISRARELLSRLKHMGIENVWRTVLEGALLEARSGNHVMARRVLKYLMHHVPWYGPLYLEAYKLEKNLGRSLEASQVVERGLVAIPRYGPLWFGAFKLCEEMDQSSQNFTLPRTMSMIDRSTLCVSKEIMWKVHLEAAHMLERSAVEFLDPANDSTAKVVMDMSRKRFARTILTCPPNLRWKVWLASGRMEVAAGNTDRARALFLRAHQVVPDKGRAVALLECARLEEYVGDTELAKAILCKSRSVSGSDWKVWLESVLLEIRCGNRVRAIELASNALKLHSGTGRLWASLIQLYHNEEGETKQFETLRQALNAVPKSGEVWCEAARVHLNPFSRSFDLPSARRHLSFATKFTPQYGDGFLETLRLEIIDQWLVPTGKLIWEMTRTKFNLDEETNKAESLVDFVGEVSRALFILCRDDSAEFKANSLVHTGLASMILSRLKPGFRDSTIYLLDLRQRCANADPNYGLLWFHCRETPSGTARQILAKATELMMQEIRSYAHVYLSALVRRLAILTQLDRQRERTVKLAEEGKALKPPPQKALSEEMVIDAYLSAPSLQEILAASDTKYNDQTQMVLLESTMTGSKFVSGLVALCDQVSLPEMASSSDKRKALFGTDALFS